MRNKRNSIYKKYNNDYDLIIRLYSMNKLYLSNSEFKKCLKLRGEKKYFHYENRKGRVIIV